MYLVKRYSFRIIIEHILKDILFMNLSALCKVIERSTTRIDQIIPRGQNGHSPEFI